MKWGCLMNIKPTKTKRCWFTIVYNELPFLKHKLPFMYANFDQIIFYDLNTETLANSNDGTIEYIKSFNDYDKKITLITDYYEMPASLASDGACCNIKHSMFLKGSEYINNNIDYFYCFDADEFISVELIKKSECILKSTDAGCIKNKHIIFYRDFETFYCNANKSIEIEINLARIAKHSPGRYYGHCGIHLDFINGNCDVPVYHYAFIFKERNLNKWTKWGFDNEIKQFKERIIDKYNKLYYYPNAHPVIPNLGLIRRKIKHPLEGLLDTSL